MSFLCKKTYNGFQLLNLLCRFFLEFWMARVDGFFQNYDQAGDQSAFTVDFTNKGDLRRGLKASFRDFWDRDISRRTADNHRCVFWRLRRLHFVTNWLWKIFNISSRARYRSPLFSTRNRSLHLLCRPLKLSWKTRCSISMVLRQEDCPPSTFGLFANGAAKLIN